MIQEKILIIHDIIILTCSLLSNFVLIILAIAKAKKSDSYSGFVIASGVLNLLYSATFFTLDINLHAENEIFILVSNRKLLPTGVGEIGLILYWTLCPAIFILTTTQFLNRYVVICRPNSAKSINNTLPFLSIILGVAYFLFSFNVMSRNALLSNHVAGHMADEHGIDVINSSIIGLVLHIPGQWRWQALTYLALFDLGYLVMMVVICTCAAKMYQKWRLHSTAQSFRNVNNQIVSALTVQATAPFLCNAIPVFLAITLPLFGFHLSLYMTLVLKFTTWFPLINALATLLLIQKYKKTLIRLVFCRQSKNQPNQTSTRSVARSSPRRQMAEPVA